MTFPFITALIFLAGLAGLVCSSHFFVGGSASLAKHLGMRPGLIGLTVVAFGTSAPEILVSAGAALEGAPDMGVGNALGSNIANIGLVLAVTAMIAKLPLNTRLLWMEVPMLAVVTALAAFFLFDFQLQRFEGIILLLLACALPAVIIIDLKIHKTLALKHQPGEEINKSLEDDLDQLEEEEIPDISLQKSLVWLIGGLVVLLFSADILVDSATTLAEYFGVSHLIIGLTVIALGTSLPELAASLASAFKGHLELAVGNILGSNVLNILAVMSLPAIILPSTLEPEVFWRDAMTMILLTVSLIAIILFKTRRSQQGVGHICIPSGILFFSIYIGYYVVIFSQVA